MPTYDPQRSRSRPRAADDDTPAPVDEILGTDADAAAPDRSFHEPSIPEPEPPAESRSVASPPTATASAPSSPRGPLPDLMGPPGGATGIPREAFIGFAAAVLVIVALVLRRRRRRRGQSTD